MKEGVGFAPDGHATLSGDSVRFLIAGGANTLLTLACYQALLSLMSPAVAYASSWIVGLIFVVTVYPERVFAGARRDARVRLRLGASYIIIFLLGLATLRMLELAGVPARGAIVAVLGVTTATNFVFSRMLLKPATSSVTVPAAVLRNSDLLACVAYAFWVGCWSLSISYNGAPDERTHFFLVEYLYRFHEFPTPYVDPATPFVGVLSGEKLSNTTFWYFGLPYLHTLGATLYAMMFAPLLPTGMGYLAARAFNWSLSAAFMGALISVARLQGLRGRWLGAAVATIAFIPQVTFIFAYFNSDAFALTSTTVALASLLRFVNKPTIQHATVFGLACGLLLCSKIYYFPALVFFASLLLIIKLVMPQLALARLTLFMALGALAIAGPVLAITYVQFGEVTGLLGQQTFVALHTDDPNYGTCFVWCNDKLFHFQDLAQWGKAIFESFFMTLGWMNIKLPWPFYLFLFWPLTFILLGVSSWFLTRALYLRDVDRLTAWWDGATVVLFWGILSSTLMLNLIGSQLLAPQPQGRYLFAALPFALLLIGRMLSRAPLVVGEPAIAQQGKFKTLSLIVAVPITLSNVIAFSILVSRNN